MEIRLNKRELEAVEFLKTFTDNLLAGRPTEYTKPMINQLERMGITLGFVSHKTVGALKRGKESPFKWIFTNAPAYIRGDSSRTYLPFQIRQVSAKHEKAQKERRDSATRKIQRDIKAMKLLRQNYHHSRSLICIFNAGNSVTQFIKAFDRLKKATKAFEEFDNPVLSRGHDNDQ